MDPLNSKIIQEQVSLKFNEFSPSVRSLVLSKLSIK